MTGACIWLCSFSELGEESRQGKSAKLTRKADSTKVVVRKQEQCISKAASKVQGQRTMREELLQWPG